MQDSLGKSCASKFNNHSTTASFFERDATWHHLAVTWTSANNGLTKIYKDGERRWDSMSAICLQSGTQRQSWWLNLLITLRIHTTHHACRPQDG